MADRQKTHGEALSTAGTSVAYSGPDGVVARAGGQLAAQAKPGREKPKSSDGKPSRRRRVAGQDPVKRDQILDGARQCFLERGFDATSMNDITSESGVSKGTLYVYFEDKEDLIGALIDRERRQVLDFARERLDLGTSIEEALNNFGTTIATKLTSRDVVRAMRVVLGMAENRPGLAAKFFGGEPFSGVEVIKDYLDRKVAEGELAIPDTDLAGRQFIDLAMAGIFKPRLFGYMPEEATVEDVARSVGSAVQMFLGFYRRRKAD